jgi:hypothetical protein
MRRLILALAFLTGLAVPASSGAHQLQLGFDDDFVFGVQHSHFQQMHEAGASRAKVIVDWAIMQGEESGPIDWTDLDGTISALSEAGISPVLSVQNAPNWARAPEDVTQGYSFGMFSPQYDWAWKNFVGAVAARYQPRYIELWNEPNIPYFGALTPERYAEILKEGKGAAYAASPRTLPIGLDLAPGSRAPEYIRDVLSMVHDRRLIVGVHLYSQDPDHIVLDIRDKLYLAMAAAGTHEVWVTETGISADIVGQDGQSRIYSALCSIFTRLNVGAVFFFRFIDPPQYHTYDGWTGMGVIDLNGEPKQAFGTLEKLFGSA